MPLRSGDELGHYRILALHRSGEAGTSGGKAIEYQQVIAGALVASLPAFARIAKMKSPHGLMINF